MTNQLTPAAMRALVTLFYLGLSASSALVHADEPGKPRTKPAPRQAATVAAPPAWRPDPAWPSVWQGFYAGASVGYGSGTSVHIYNRNDNHGAAEQSPSGALGGLTIGYNYLMSPNVVAGIEGDLGVMDLSAGDKVIFDGHVWKTQFGPAWGTMRGRLGFLMGQTLLYGTAGLAFMSVDEIGIGDAARQTAWNRSFRTGWVLGAGVEHALSERMTAKVEFLHMDFGTYNGLSENQETYSFENSVNVIRAGLNMRF